MGKKRYLYLIVVFLLAFSLALGGCGNNGGEEDEEEKVGDFTLISPADEAEEVETVAQFEWSGSVNALKYTLTIAKSAEFEEEDIVYVKQNIASPYFTLSETELENDTTYYWKVEAIGRGEGNVKTASNAPFSFTTESDNEIAMRINHLSYLSGDDVEIVYTAPAAAQSLTLQVSADRFFSDQSQQVLSEQLSGGSHSFSKSGLAGKYYARIAAEIKGNTVYTDAEEFYIGEVYKLHDFSAESGGSSGGNNGIRLYKSTHMSYQIVDGALKITYTANSFLDYTIIDLSDDLKTVIADAKYFYIRYKCEAYLGYFLCKMRGDESQTGNWMDYYINNIPGDNEWKEALIEINVENVINFNRMSMGVSTQIDGVIYVDDIYFIMPSDV